MDSLNEISRISPASAWPAIAAAVSGLQYGQVTVIVHDGHVVQIERTERQRLSISESRAREYEVRTRES